MKKIIMIAAAGVIFVLLGGIAFYAIPYVKANQSIVYVNRNGTGASEESDWLSVSDLQLLQIVEEDMIREEIGIELNTKTKLSWQSWNRISVICDITAAAEYTDSGEELARYRQKREIVFHFSHLKWKVVQVNIL